MTIRSKASSLIERLNRSQWALRFGLRGGKRTGSTPLALSNASNAWVTFVSLSWIRYRLPSRNPSRAPGRIFFGHLDHELLDLLSDTRSATRSSLRIPIKLVGDQLLIPPQEGVGSDKGRHVLQALAAEWVGQRREATPFGIREAKATTAELGFEHAVFRQKIRDDLLLVTLQPASN